MLQSTANELPEAVVTKIGRRSAVSVQNSAGNATAAGMKRSTGVMRGLLEKTWSDRELLGVERIGSWSGRWDLNPRQLAWEARTLPLSYARPESENVNPTPASALSQGNGSRADHP